MDVNKSVFSWSGGKDSSLALYHVLKNKTHDVDLLLANINSFRNRLSMHGVRRELIEAQARSIGIPLSFVELPAQPTMKEFDQLLGSKLNHLKEQGIEEVIYGDIFLEDLKNYRVNQLKALGLKAHFPIWGRDTTELVNEFIGVGFKAIVVCVKSDFMNESFVGRIIDKSFLADLPENVDPCGENGEFHSFVFDGPIFKNKIAFKIGEKIYKEYKAPKKMDKADTLSKEINSKKMGFWFCDLKIT